MRARPLLAACLAIEAAGADVGPSVVEVSTPLGALMGLDYGEFVAFKGVPYAEPARRFEHSSPKAPWQGLQRDATHFGDACISASSNAASDADPLESYGESEDCLFANVWVPKGANGTRLQEGADLPVIVWVHGGGFMLRTGSFAAYWGDGVVSHPEAPVVLVTFNYRLGIFGFYSAEDTGANFALTDQQQLLRWVQGNIRAFGGDPQRVTLIGQSAGAMSVLSHIASPASKGLFHRAVASSPVGVHYRTLEENAQFVGTVATSVGCGWASNRTACIRSRSATALKAAEAAPEYAAHIRNPCPECANILAWVPTIDGQILTGSPPDVISKGAHNKVPTLISFTRNETLAFVPSILMKFGNNWAAEKLIMSIGFKDRADAIAQHYAKSPDMVNVTDRATRVGIITADALMACYARYVARLLSLHAPAYLSLFEVAPSSSVMHANGACVAGPPDGATCHAGDVAYILPQTARMSKRSGIVYHGSEAELARQYSAHLAAFASGTEGPFIRYNGTDDAGVSWDQAGVGRLQHYHKDHCDFLESQGFPADPWGTSEATPAPVASGMAEIIV